MKRLTKNALLAVLVGGSIAGILDITYAVVFSGFRGVPALRVLQSVASGLFGAAAFKGGLPIAILGLLLHFLIALSAAAIFYIASRRFPLLTQRPILCGIAYGLIIYGVMNLVALPLSAYPRRVTFPPLVLTTGLLVHMFFIGLPISLAVRKFAKTEKLTISERAGFSRRPQDESYSERSVIIGSTREARRAG